VPFSPDRVIALSTADAWVEFPCQAGFMSHAPGPLDHTFTAPIGVEVKGEMWACVEMPGSGDFFGTSKAVRVDATVDGVPITNAGLMPTGLGGHMLSLNAKLRKQLSKDIGDEVAVHLTQRRT
jgi:hypothetical protein